MGHVQDRRRHRPRVAAQNSEILRNLAVARDNTPVVVDADDWHHADDVGRILFIGHISERN